MDATRAGYLSGIRILGKPGMGPAATHPRCGVRQSSEPIGVRQAGASKGSAKYCVSWTTLPLRNSIMLTVYAGSPLVGDCVFRDPEIFASENSPDVET